MDDVYIFATYKILIISNESVAPSSRLHFEAAKCNRRETSLDLLRARETLDYESISFQREGLTY